MNKAIPYAAFFLSFPVIITAPGQYITRSGEAVEIEAARDAHWMVGKYACGTTETWHRSGRIFSGKQTQNDIIAKA